MVEQARIRQRLSVGGVVQGVGFRPFVYALARELRLAGKVWNTADGVEVEVEGAAAAVTAFAGRVVSDAPALAVVTSFVVDEMAMGGGTDFVIGDSVGSAAGRGRTLVSPDVATCDACLREMADPGDRRYRHAFISCTNCGPRFTIITDLPYDRPSTTMADLPLCTACAGEYADPADRRFHAQTVACPDCGPVLSLHGDGQPSLTGDAAIIGARRLLVHGAIVAVKGLGGYHLACNAFDDTAVSALRKRKDRGDKPFAVMVPDLATAERLAVLSDAERTQLTDHRRPVVLVRASQDASRQLSREVAPGMAEVGLMLPYTPVHHLLLEAGGGGVSALVMTSGNRAGEPIVIDNEQAVVRLAGLADAWLEHDRPIQVPCDDSVVRVVDGVLPVRRSRGYAPLPVALPVPMRPTLAVGGDLKNTFAFADGSSAWLSGHIGDMDDLATLTAFASATEHLAAITGVVPQVIVADTHPGFRSRRWAAQHAAAGGLELRTVQHHHAHIASAMAENGHDGSEPVIGVAFDGTGYGDDGAVWGGEVLLADYDGYHRAAHLKYVWLPGGDAGVRNPARMALSHLRAAGVHWDEVLPPVRATSQAERAVVARQVQTGLASAPTSSMGRLFDAVSAIAGVCQRAAYEAEAAMRFEALARDAIGDCGRPYRFDLSTSEHPDEARLMDAGPVVAATAADVLAGVPAPVIAARFHLAVVEVVVRLAMALRADTGCSTVALSGGVFLNALLSSLCARRLRDNDFRVLTHHLVPPSDAGLCLGQLAVAGRTSMSFLSKREGAAPCAWQSPAR